jgi:hypothetical protein
MAVVARLLVKPLADKEAKQNRFSRAYIPPQARRVRIEGERSTDGTGAEFVAFAVDERSGRLAARNDDDSGWRKDAIVGCVYPARDEVFIKRGDKFFGAALLLGKKTAAAGEAVCRPAPVRRATSTGAHSAPGAPRLAWAAASFRRTQIAKRHTGQATVSTRATLRADANDGRPRWRATETRASARRRG